MSRTGDTIPAPKTIVVKVMVSEASPPLLKEMAELPPSARARRLLVLAHTGLLAELQAQRGISAMPAHISEAPVRDDNDTRTRGKLLDKVTSLDF